MRKKPRFKWGEVEARSLYEIVHEDGALRTKDILFITRQMCLLLDRQQKPVRQEQRPFIHPKNVIVTMDGSVYLVNRNLPLSIVEPYLPPECDHSDPSSPRTHVYALGMLMLFMATGKEKRTDVEAVIGDRSLLPLIKRCIAFDPKARMQHTNDLLKTIRNTGTTGKKTLNALMVLAFAGLMLGLFFILWREGEARGGALGEKPGFDAGYAGGYEQGLSDAPGIGVSGASFDTKNGNLSGNLSAKNGAIAARSEDSVYFLLAGTIYQMNPYTREIRTLVEDSGANDLHYYGHQIYYTTDEQVICFDPETGKEDVLCNAHTGRFYIYDGIFYLYDSATLYLYEIDPLSKTLRQLNGAMDCLSLQIVSHKLYYIAPDRGHSIYRCDLDGGNDTLVSSNAYESFCIYDDKLYAGTGSGLIRMDLNGGNPEWLTTQPASSPNVSDGGIFYVSGNDRTLEWLSFDGKMRYTVVSGRTGFFNIAGQWIFYRNMDDDGKLWRVRVNGSDNARLSP